MYMSHTSIEKVLMLSVLEIYYLILEPQIMLNELPFKHLRIKILIAIVKPMNAINEYVLSDSFMN